MGAVACANLVIVPVGHGQVEYEAYQERDLEGPAGDLEREKTAELQREKTRALHDSIDEREAEMRANWDAFDEALNSMTDSFNLSAIPRPSLTGPRFSTNIFGATFEVPVGRYSGEGLVGLMEVTRTESGANPVPIVRTITRGQPGLRHVSSGWTFEQGSMLKETYNVVSATVSTSPPVTQCHVSTRFQHINPTGGTQEFLNRGVEQTCDFTLVGIATPDACASSAPSRCNATRPTQYWSTNGQVALDFTNPNRPRLDYPDGTTEVFRSRARDAYVPFNEGLLDPLDNHSSFVNGMWFTEKTISRNGSTSVYSYDPNTGWLQSVSDPKGRATQYTRDNAGRVTSITTPGPGAGTLTWLMTWAPLTWNPGAIFPDIVCLGGNGNTVPCPSSLSYTTLTSLRTPDGRQFAFAYGPWGNLDRVTTPDGAVTDFDYGNAATPTFAAPRFGAVPSFTFALDRRHLTAVTVYPKGLSQSGFTTRIDHDTTENLPAGPGALCPRLNWVKRTYPDGNVMREGQCGVLTTSFLSGYGRTFAQEIWQGSTLLRGTYYGNTGNIGDTTTPVGDMYIDFETSPSPVIGGVDLDVRPTKVIHKKDGVVWTERFTYGTTDIPVVPRCSGCNTARTSGNVTHKRLLDSSGNVLSHQITSYVHEADPAYSSRNLLRLPASVRLKDGNGVVLSHTEYRYDEFEPLFSGAPNLDTSVGSIRGNETTVITYKDAENGLNLVATHKHYFDTGDVRQTIDANDNPTTMNYDFAICSENHQTVSGTVQNAKGHLLTTISDCNTGLPLRVIDPNGQSTFTQYDSLARTVEAAGPGDTLTPIPGLIRHPNAPLNSGSVIGANGQGPGVWIEYLSLGVIDQQHTVAHTKDGTANGRYVKTFVDGLGRTIQTRSEVDPTNSPGHEVVVTSEYDSAGRVSKSYVPVFAGPSDSFVSPSTGSLATITSYDALGRPTSVQAPGVPPVRTAYTGAGLQFSTTITDAKGNQTINHLDVLGRKIRVLQQSSNCSDPMLGNWCVTSMQYDAAGRLLTIIDPRFNQTTFIYDGLGRKKQMTDPDMGTWMYDYDDCGNLIRQIDAKGQTIQFSYDVLNRITRKDLPGPEDTTYFYDGEQAP